VYNVSLCNYRIYLSSFSILNIAAVRQILSKIKTLTLRQVLETIGLCITSVPNFTTISQTIAEICRLSGFKMAAVRHLGFLKFNFLTVGAVKNTILHHLPNFLKIGQTVEEIS